MSERKRLIYLILIMTGVSLVVGGIAIGVLYRAAMDEARNHLVETAQSQARLIEAIARFDAVRSSDFPQGSAAATISQIVDAHKHYKGFGRTGEFTLARREGERIVFLLSHRHHDLENPKPVLWNSELAEPMRLALSGRSGTVVALDYHGVVVLAAHEPVSELDLGIVAKIDLAEVRAPFVRAGLVGLGAAAVVVVLGSLLFVWVSAPIFRGLQERETRLRAVLDTAVDGIITIDERGTVESLNQAACVLFGYADEEVIGHNVKILMPPPYHEEHDGYLANYLNTGEKKIIGIGREVVGMRKDGSDFSMDLAVSEFRVGGRRFFTGIVRDITDRKEAEESFRQEHEFSESIIDTAHTIILVLDTDGRIVRFNPFLEELSGYTLDEVHGKNWFETFLPTTDQNRIHELFQKAINDISIEGNVNPIVTKSGRQREIRWWAKTLKSGDDNVIGVLCIGHDVTELIKAQKRLVQSERLSAIGEAMTGLTHESRNALQRAQANLEMLEFDLENQPDLLDLTKRTKKALDDLHRLFEEVRGYAVPIKLERETCDLQHVWARTWKNLEVARGGKAVQLQEETNGLKLQCLIDPHHIEQVIRNIFENSLAAVPESGEIVVRCADADINGEPAIRVSFRDNGPGLTTEQAQGIFEPFFTTKQKGTGLGMAIAKQIVESHRGTIEVASPSQPGAEIIVTLPRESG